MLAAVLNSSTSDTRPRSWLARMRSRPTRTPPTMRPMMTSTMESSMRVKPDFCGNLRFKTGFALW